MKSAPLQQTDLGWLTSRSGDPIFWTPERLGRPSAWWGHVPFAFWLTAQCKPRLLVELGTDCGVSYAAFCETVLRLGLATRCFAVDTWQGDAHAGHYGGEVYLDLAEFHERRYGAFSRLLRRTFDDARAEFADATIDLLHIDGYHTYEAVRHDFDAWRPKLSERAVVLFHDSNERRDDFGVWRLFDELKRDAPSFEFPIAMVLASSPLAPTRQKRSRRFALSPRTMKSRWLASGFRSSAHTGLSWPSRRRRSKNSPSARSGSKRRIASRPPVAKRWRAK
jgi:hypothetical protein